MKKFSKAQFEEKNNANKMIEQNKDQKDQSSKCDQKMGQNKWQDQINKCAQKMGQNKWQNQANSAQKTDNNMNNNANNAEKSGNWGKKEENKWNKK